MGLLHPQKKGVFFCGGAVRCRVFSLVATLNDSTECHSNLHTGPLEYYLPREFWTRWASMPLLCAYALISNVPRYSHWLTQLGAVQHTVTSDPSCAGEGVLRRAVELTSSAAPLTALPWSVATLQRHSSWRGLTNSKGIEAGSLHLKRQIILLFFGSLFVFSNERPF